MSQPLASLPTWILSSAATRSHQILRQALGEAGVDGYEYRCLSALAALGQASQAALAEAAALDPGDVTHTLKALERRGLVVRVPDPAHGRRRLVSLTGEGEATARRTEAVMADIQDRVFGGLSAEERSALMDLLERVGRQGAIERR